MVDINSGKVVEEYSFDEFGISEDLPKNPMLPFGFAGGLYDDETGLVHFGMREYDAEMGRWTTKDPIGFIGGDTNLYGYVASDPVNFVDPSGLAQADLIAATNFLKSVNPGLFAANPTVLNANLQAHSFFDDDSFGVTRIYDLILIDFTAIDNAFTDSSSRIAKYVETLSHELMHSLDLFRYGNLMGHLYTINPLRHNKIRDQALCYRTMYEGNPYACDCK